MIYSKTTKKLTLHPHKDPFAGFSPKDTLCGDLNQGRVPLNPLGQNILDQSYPFELIKNKTLQFLAKALPVLKLEYETIPKVARYMPAQQHLLNPTSQASPLTIEHFSLLNEKFAAANGFTAEELMSLAATPYLQQQHQQRLKRKKRSTSAASRGGKNHDNLVVTIAELSPNATLLVSSAHSARFQAAPPSSLAQLKANDSTLLMITKDGYRSVQYPHFQAKAAQRAPGSQHLSATSGQLVVSSPHSSTTSTSTTSTTTTTSTTDLPQIKDESSPAPSGSKVEFWSLNNKNNANDHRQQQQQQSSGTTKGHHVAANSKLAPRSSELISQESVGRARSNGDTTTAASTTSSNANTSNSNNGKQANKRSKLACSEAGNGFTSA